MFACKEPCEASELVHFRNCIGDEGGRLILKEGIRVNGKDGEEGTTDTTVQEKNKGVQQISFYAAFL